MKRIHIYSWLTVMVAMLFGGVSCQNGFSGERFDTEDKMQIYDYAKSRSDLSTFVELMDYTGYSSLMSTAGGYTIFMPDNDAFTVLFGLLSTSEKPVAKIADLDKEFWLDYVKYHSVDARLETNTFDNGVLSEPTLLGEEFFIVTDIRASFKNIKLNSRATIKESNVKVANGLVNIIDQVLLPPTRSIYDILHSSGKYTKMLEILDRTGYSSYLKDTTVTVIVTPDAVFERSNFDEEALSVSLADWASYHIIKDERYFTSNLEGLAVNSLYPFQSLAFSIDSVGQMWCNQVFPFSTTLEEGVDNVAKNGVYHVLDTIVDVVESLPGRRRHNLYGATKYDVDGNILYEVNCFTSSPAKVYEDVGTSSFHQGQKTPIAGFDVTQVGENFTTTIKDVVPFKYQVRMMYRGTKTVKLMMVYDNDIIVRDADMNAKTGAFAEWNTMNYKDMGIIEVKERGDVELLFQVTHMYRTPGECCDLMMDMIDLIPIEEEDNQ